MPSSSNAARVQGAGPLTGAGDPIDVNVLTAPPLVGPITVDQGLPNAGGLLAWPVVITGGGGGPVTIADCADVAQGCIADAKVLGDNPGTVSAKLRGLDTILTDVWDPINHRLIVAGGNVSVTLIDGADVALGATTDAKVLGDNPGTVSAKLRGLDTILTSVWNVAQSQLQVGIFGPGLNQMDVPIENNNFAGGNGGILIFGRDVESVPNKYRVVRLDVDGRTICHVENTAHNAFLDFTSPDFDTGGGTVATSILGIALPGAGGPVIGGTVTNPLQVAGSLAATQGTSPWLVAGQVARNTVADPNPVVAGGRDPGTGRVQTWKVDANGLGSVDTELAAAAASFAAAPTTAPVWAVPLLGTLSGAQLAINAGDRSTVLTSAVRSATTNSSAETTVRKGAVYILDVTAASGTGGLSFTVQSQDVQTGTWVTVSPTPTPITATGKYVFWVYPGATVTGTNVQSFSMPLPGQWRLQIVHADASNYTYSLSVCFTEPY